MHLSREIVKLKKMILALCALVEENVEKAVKSVNRLDDALARKVIDSDSDIDIMEVDVEEECLKILALHQPVAIDLRYVVAILKINNDLERIGDLAVNIAETALVLSTRSPAGTPVHFDEMVGKTQAMLHGSLDAMVNMDADLARQVCTADDEVDDLHRQTYSVIEEGIRANPGQIDVYIRLLSVSRQLERIADYATNIAEDVIYMTRGVIIRHQSPERGCREADSGT